MRRTLCLLLCLSLLCALPLPGAWAQEAEEPLPVLHYLLLGRDAYTPSSFDFSRTDTVLLVSLDRAGGRIVLTSILRDSVVTTPKGAENKINSVFRNYGFEGIKSTVEQHLEIELRGTVVIDFDTVKQLIDALGGVDLELTINEVLQISSILMHDDPNLPKNAGMNHLTGRIALAYMRDRSSGDGDFSRVERQRKVLTQLLYKCRSLSVSELIDVYNAVYGGLQTDLDALGLLEAVSAGLTLMHGEVVQFTIPQSRTYSYGTLRGSSVVNVRWDKNRALFFELFQQPLPEEPS